jgi:predicted ribonuclease YlaK
LKKTFVLDTSVILYDPQCIYKFEDNVVVVPITVLEEMDRFKKDLTEIGRNARHFSRYLDEIRKFITSDYFFDTWCDEAPYGKIANRIQGYINSVQVSQ